MVDTEIRRIVFFAAKREKLHTAAETRLGAGCGSDHGLLWPRSDLLDHGVLWPRSDLLDHGLLMAT